jgi:hypothetical protein
MNARSDSSVHAARPLWACFAHSAPRTFPLHTLEHIGCLTLRSHAFGLHTTFEHTAHATNAPFRSLSGFRGRALEAAE